MKPQNVAESRVQVSIRVQRLTAECAPKTERKGAQVPVQTMQTQREAGAVVVRRRVAHSATRAKSLHRRP